jgi:hypothetical protein
MRKKYFYLLSIHLTNEVVNFIVDLEMYINLLWIYIISGPRMVCNLWFISSKLHIFYPLAKVRGWKTYNSLDKIHVKVQTIKNSFYHTQWNFSKPDSILGPKDYDRFVEMAGFVRRSLQRNVRHAGTWIIGRYSGRAVFFGVIPV